MGVSKQQAIENKEAIVAAAEKLFRERGVSAVGLAELTKAAGFTQGGFYNHFKSKDALVAAVMEKAMKGGAVVVMDAIGDPTADEDDLRRHVEWYLSSSHLTNIEEGCPLTAYAGDVRRLGEDARQTYAHGLAWNIDRLTAVMRGDDPQEKRKQAVALFSQMVGSLLLARAVVDADRELAEEILKDGRERVLQAMAAE